MKTALITGSTKGIGKQIGLDLLTKGYFVIFNSHTQESANQLSAELEETDYSNQNLIYVEDLSKYKSAMDFSTIFKNIDCLIWNTGITDRTPFGNISIDDWNRVFEANLTVPFFVIQELKNRINNGGRIILISSILGIIPESVSISYGVSKAAINMMVPYLAKEFKEKFITVNAIAPGFVDTDWHKNKTPEQIKRIKEKCLANRFATTAEISQMALTIIDNGYINGQIIRIDGGYGL